MSIPLSVHLPCLTLTLLIEVPVALAPLARRTGAGRALLPPAERPRVTGAELRAEVADFEAVD